MTGAEWLLIVLGSVYLGKILYRFIGLIDHI